MVRGLAGPGGAAAGNGASERPLDAVDAMGVRLGPPRRHRRDSGHRTKPVPVVVDDQRVVVATFFHLALLDERVEGVLY